MNKKNIDIKYLNLAILCFIYHFLQSSTILNYGFHRRIYLELWTLISIRQGTGLLILLQMFFVFIFYRFLMLYTIILHLWPKKIQWGKWWNMTQKKQKKEEEPTALVPYRPYDHCTPPLAHHCFAASRTWVARYNNLNFYMQHAQQCQDQSEYPGGEASIASFCL